ncbi:serine/threonine protein kinase [Gimesia maris]|uniref:Serine/threonine-protein kinase PrkC n=1 Tax=Gimesia maris TaxID=122 RepID=A0ABX5YR38_9PLAN|nr:serine/threonine-protein kinase [Gimesia maris]EDL59588.1 serine/threonine protein kinase [Gimesia maris DSM 8797]QDU16023.1 Serine/threonine-protein kinase PrkC [Gimesia maris]QEG18050.1 Serine/threonine-protein kinase PrkC [Gimesia maris]QGQ28930.1 protein kinase [Gimesia maris]
MPSEKPQNKTSKVSAETPDDRSVSPPREPEGLRLPPVGSFVEADSTQETIYRSSETTQKIHPPVESGSLIGKQLGDFKILRKLGQGGMATVYLAEQVSLKREAAIKVMHSELMSDETHVRRFEREAKAAAGLTHPNIVQVYMTGDFEGTHYIAQEYVRGVNLKEHLARNTPPDCTLILRIMRQVTAALNAAAEKGIVHRDIKPENIMITSRKLIKVADFGLAQIGQTEERVNLTQVGTTMGTPLYMSPEQVNGRNLDQRSDIYSLGVTCYHLISGKPPFHGETALSIAVKHLNEAAYPLKKRRPDLPEELCNLVHRMMEKDPNKRPGNAAELMQEIKKISEDSPGIRKRSWSEMLPFQGNRSFQKQLLAFVLASFCLGGVAAAVGWVNRPGNPLEAPFTVSGNEDSEPSFIPNEENASRQFFLATRLGVSEDAWQAVISNFPDNEIYTPKAKIRLGVLLIRPGRYEEAKAIFQELVNSGQAEQVTNGYAGLLVLESLNGHPRKSQDIWELYVNNHQEQLDGELREIVYDALVWNQNSPEIEKKDYKKLFESLQSEEEQNFTP